jgi:hypothetical protein
LSARPSRKTKTKAPGFAWTNNQDVTQRNSISELVQLAERCEEIAPQKHNREQDHKTWQRELGASFEYAHIFFTVLPGCFSAGQIHSATDSKIQMFEASIQIEVKSLVRMQDWV